MRNVARKRCPTRQWPPMHRHKVERAGHTNSLPSGGRASQQTNVFPNVNELIKEAGRSQQRNEQEHCLRKSAIAQGTTRFSMEDSAGTPGWTSGRGVERMLTFISRFSRSFFSVGSNGKHDNRGAHERDPCCVHLGWWEKPILASRIIWWGVAW